MRSLESVHRALDEMFGLFRELVLVGAGEAAATVLASYRALTARHAADEEAHLLPLLGADARWPAALYTGQHAKLLAGLDRVALVVAGLDARRPGWRRHALAVLDAAGSVHHLVEHHHLAEEQALFVEVAAVAPEVLVRLAGEWHAEAATHAAALATAGVALGDEAHHLPDDAR